MARNATNRQTFRANEAQAFDMVDLFGQDAPAFVDAGGSVQRDSLAYAEMMWCCEDCDGPFERVADYYLGGRQAQVELAVSLAIF